MARTCIQISYIRYEQLIIKLYKISLTRQQVLIQDCLSLQSLLLDSDQESDVPLLILCSKNRQLFDPLEIMENTQAQTHLAKDICKQSKKAIVQASKTLSFNLSPNWTKERLANDFVKGLIEIIKNNKGIQIPAEITIKSICQIVKDQEIVKSLRKHFQIKTQQLARQSPPNSRKNINSVQNIKDNMKCLCNNTYNGQVDQCRDCYRQFHVACLKILKNQRFECPYCFAINMDPLNEVKEILYCGYMSSENRNHRINFPFNPASDQYRYLLEVRCFRLDGKNNYSITWPDCGDVKLNELKILQLNPLAQNSSLKKRKDEIVLIDKKNIRFNNSIVISQTASQSREYRVGNYNHFIMICFVKSFTRQELFQKVLSSVNYVKKSQQRSQIEGGQDIQMEKVYVELKCPLSFQRIKVPVKGRQCVHDTCMDLQSVLIFNKSAHRQWRCSICKKKFHYLVINQVLQKIIKDNSHLNLAGVTFMRDGTYTLTEEKPQESDEEDIEKAKMPIIIEIQDDSSDVIQIEQPPSQNKFNFSSLREQTDGNQLNRPIPLLQMPIDREDTSIVPDQWEMESFQHDPALRALSMAQEQFQEQFEQHQKQYIQEQKERNQKRLLVKKFQLEHTDKTLLNQLPLQKPQPVAQQTFQIPENCFNAQSQKQNCENQENQVNLNGRQEEKEAQKGQGSIYNLPIQDEESQQDSIIVIFQKKKSNIGEMRTSLPSEQPDTNIAPISHQRFSQKMLSEKTKQKQVSSKMQVPVIDILDSDDETGDERYERYLRDEKFQLHQMVLQRNIFQTKTSTNQEIIVKKLANKLLLAFK